MADEIVHTYEPNGKRAFVLVVAKEGIRTVDGREFAAGALTWREPPIPFMMQRENDPTGRGGHKGSTAVGMIGELWRENDAEGFGTVYAKGYFADDELGQSAEKLIAQGIISGVSADVGGAIHEELELGSEEDAQIIPRITYGEILAVTALPIPAFDGTKVSTVSPEAVTAASGPEGWAPPSEWFEDPKLDKPTPVTVTADGRIFGHAAVWGTCHVGFRDRCVTPPKSASDYAYFNVGNVITADGKTVNVGRLTAGTGHAALEFGAQPAIQHYDNTGWGAGYVHAGEDAHGIWFAGAIAPSATPEQIATVRASAVSGDWRAIRNSLELVGILSVNTPGFPIPRAKAGLIAGAQVSLIASGICPCEAENAEIVELDADGTTATLVEAIAVDTADEVAAKLRQADLAMADWKVAKSKGKKACCPDCA